MAKHRDCCFEPGLARAVRRKLTSSAELLQSGPVLDVIDSSLRHTPVSNAQSEDRFARQSAQKFMCHGHPTTHVTAATRHVLNEIQTTHHLAMERFQLNVEETIGRTLPVDRMPNPRSGWNVFVMKNAERQIDLKTLAAEWNRLPQSERDAFDEKVAPPAAAGAAHPAGPPLYTDVVQHTPSQIGDRNYPLRASFVEKATASLLPSHRLWEKMVGGLISRDATLELKNADIKQCCDLFGRGTCYSDWTADEHAVFTQQKRVLWALARINRTMNEDMDDMLLFGLKKV
jgi:hypothetical protein